MTKMNPDKNRRILVIDDNKSIHGDFRKILSPDEPARAALDAAEAALFGDSAHEKLQIQFEIDSAYQGEEGVARAGEALAAGSPYAVAFVDMRMPPGWDGMKTAQELWEVDPEIQIVICTAYSAYSWEEISEKIGSNDRMVILKKPFDTVEALRLAHALTDKWALNHPAPKEEPEQTPGSNNRKNTNANHGSI